MKRKTKNEWYDMIVQVNALRDEHHYYRLKLTKLLWKLFLDA